MKQFYQKEDIIDLQAIAERKKSKRVSMKTVAKKLGLEIKKRNSHY